MMAAPDILTHTLAWFVFGAVAFLGAFTAYHVIKSRVVQAIAVFILSMLGGFGILVLIGVAIAKISN